MSENLAGVPEQPEPATSSVSSPDTDELIEKLNALALPPAAEWPGRERDARRQLPFPLGHLVLGVYSQRSNPAAFVSCLTWFFEAAYRFLLALMLRPLILGGPLDGDVWRFLGKLLSLPDSRDDNLTLGAWKDFFFASFTRVLSGEEAQKRLPDFLYEYGRHPDRVQRLRDIYSAFVHFRNRLEHGVRDGNAPDFRARERDLYERALIQFLLDFEVLSSYGLILFKPESSSRFAPVQIDSEGATVPRSDIDLPLGTVYAQAGSPVPYEAFLVRWSMREDRVVGAWSMYPFLTFSPRPDGRFDARLFRKYVPTPEPAVLFDPAISDSVEPKSPLRVTDPELIKLLERLIEILVKRRAKSSATGTGHSATPVVTRVIEEQERERRELIEQQEREAEQRRRLHLDRIPYPRDPLFRGREKDLNDIVAALRERQSLQVQSYIYGMGGVGKTALAVELCYRLIEEDVFRDGILWYRVQIEDLDHVIEECARSLKLGSKLDPQARGTANQQSFRELIHRMDLMVVLDNADQPLQVLQPLFELFEGVPLLITSRNELDLPGALTIRLGGMEAEDAMAFLKAVLGHRDRNNPEAWRQYGKEAEVAKLAKTLGYLPLAMKLAAYHMLQHRLSVRDYLERWRTQRDRFGLLQAHLPAKEARLRDVHACFGLSFDILSHRAKRLLTHMSTWEGREVSLAHLQQTLDEVVYPPAVHHDGAITAVADLNGGSFLTGGDDGRVLLWTGLQARPITVVRMSAPVCHIVPFNSGNQFVAVDSTGMTATQSAKPSDDRITRPSWRKLKAARPLTLMSNGSPAIKVIAGRHEVLVPLEKDARAEVRPLAGQAEVHAEPSPALKSWLEQSGRTWRLLTLPTASYDTPPASWLDGLPVASTEVTSSRRLNRSDRAWLFDIEASDTLILGEEDALKELIVGELAGTSLAEDRIAENGELRLRLHPLVSEFAIEQLPWEQRQQRRDTVQRFYIDQFRKKAAFVDIEEQNVLAACAWYLENAEQGELVSGDVAVICDNLSERGRWPVLQQFYETRISAAEAAGKKHKAAELKCLFAYFMRHMDPEATGSFVNQALRDLVLASRSEPLHTNTTIRVLELIANKGWSGVLHDRTEIELSLRRARDARSDPKALAWELENWFNVQQMQQVFENRAATSPDELSKLRSRVIAARWLPLADSLQVQREAIDVAVRLGSNMSLALVLVDHIGTLIASDLYDAAQAALRDYRALAELRSSRMAKAYCNEAEALLLATKGATGDARRMASLAFDFWSYVEEGAHIPQARGLLHLLAVVQDWTALETLLRRVRGSWSVCDLGQRWAFHSASARLALHQEKPDQARSSWARAEMYREARLLTPTKEASFRDFTSLGRQIVLSEEELEAARRAVWGPTGAPRIMVQPPAYIPKPERFLLPSHLRWHAITVEEVRVFCTERAELGWRLPWYYREFRPDADSEEPARFLDHSIAVAIASWLAEELPAAAAWRGLPPHKGWQPQPSECEYLAAKIPDDVPLATWAREVDVYRSLSSAMIDRLEVDAQELAQGLLLSDALTPLDKWRLLTRLAADGIKGVAPRTRHLLSLRLRHSVMSMFAAGIRQRLLLDWHSLAFLANLRDAPPSSLWLRPEFVAQPKTLGALAEIGVIGGLQQVSEPGTMLLVPANCSWANVMAWPCTILDPSPYIEEAPKWP